MHEYHLNLQSKSIAKNFPAKGYGRSSKSYSDLSNDYSIKEKKSRDKEILNIRRKLHYKSKIKFELRIIALIERKPHPKTCLIKTADVIDQDNSKVLD